MLKALREAIAANKIKLNWQQTKMYSNMLTCHTMERGGRILKCPECGTKMVSYNPCNQRGCPACSQKNQIIWKESTEKRLLSISHYHIVFSPPPEWITKWFEEPEDAIRVLMGTVDTVLKEYEKHIGLNMGYVLVFQSHGRGLCYKPHVHCVLTAGGTLYGTDWKPFTALSCRYLESLFDENWTIHAELHKNSPRRIIDYLSKAVHGLPIDVEHNVIEDEQEKTVTIIEEHLGIKREINLDVLVFLERYWNHIPPLHVVTIRYYGLYSNRHTPALEAIRQQCVEVEKPEHHEKILAKCPHCQHSMNIECEFDRIEGVLVMTNLGYYDSPPKHNEIIHAA